MNLAEITPVVLTYNEEPNIGRTLAQLSWAREVVVVDSHSTDRTREIAGTFPNVRLLTRTFDRHDKQWQYAVYESGIETGWVLTLDADYVIPEAFVAELCDLVPDESIAGYNADFRFLVHGRPLRRSNMLPRIVLFCRARGLFYQDGHTQQIRIDGRVAKLRTLIDHDDRKPLGHWLQAQDRYARLELIKLASSTTELPLSDRIRKYRVIAPLFLLVYCLVYKRLMFEGWAGWHYTYQRVVAEIILSLYLVESRLAESDGQ